MQCLSQCAPCAIGLLCHSVDLRAPVYVSPCTFISVGLTSAVIVVWQLSSLLHPLVFLCLEHLCISSCRMIVAVGVPAG